MVWLGAAGVAVADDPPCDPTTAPTARFTGLPDQLIEGRDLKFSIADNRVSVATRVWSDIDVTLSESGVVFWSGTVKLEDVENDEPGLLSIRSDPGDAPRTVSAAFTELFESQQGSRVCARVISKTMPVVPGGPLAAPRVQTPFKQDGLFVLRTPEGCLGTSAPSPVAVSAKPERGGRWVTMAVADQCVGWRGRARGRHFVLEQSSERSALFFRPRTPARVGFEVFHYRVSRATVGGDGSVRLGTTLRRGSFFVVARYDSCSRSTVRRIWREPW